MAGKQTRQDIRQIADMTEADFKKYFEVRLESKIRRSGVSYKALCPFHPDQKTPSLSMRFDVGIWKCHGCQRGGGLIEFEKQLDPSCDTQTAVARIAEIVGLPQLNLGGGGPEAVYPYVDAQGKLLFQVVRYPNKKFMQRKLDANGAWEYKTSDLKMVPYNLDKIVMAREVIVNEGEKDADNINRLIEDAGITGVVATTSPRGAGKWQDSFAPYFVGKKVVIVQDKDEPGRKHGLRVADSLYRYVYGVKLGELPDWNGKSVKDASDFLNAGGTLRDLIAQFKQWEQWHPEVQDGMFTTVTAFEQAVPDAVNWLIEGVAEVGSNGMIIARPKGGKSCLVLDMAIALAVGSPWLTFHIPRRVKTALISREDNPTTTGHRIRRMRKGRGIDQSELDGWLWINSRKQRKAFSLESDDDVAALISELKRRSMEVVIFDVMRVLHSKDENDNTEMQGVLEILNRVRDETGCTIVLVHHAKKGDESSLTEMARGAGATAGWTEWIAGIKVVDKRDPAHWVRSVEFELKGGQAPIAPNIAWGNTFYWQIVDGEGGESRMTCELKETSYKPPKPDRRKKKSGEAEVDDPEDGGTGFDPNRL